MRGKRTKWIYGTDHAGIAIQRQVEKALAEEGTTKEELGREAFVERVWEWRREHGSTITEQFKRLGASLDYEDERFTMDDDYQRAVALVFVRLYEKGLVYRDNYMVNWDPGLRTAISDLEVEQRSVEDTLYSIDYPLESGSGSITVATVRPETMLADTAIAVNPDDERYSRLIGETAILPLVGRRLPVIADEHVDPEFGTGALKITPGHDPADFEIGRRHGLDEVSVIGEDGRITDAAPERFRGMDVDEARAAVVAELREQGLISATEPYVHDVPHSHRSGRRIEPLISLQWFCDMNELARPAIEAVRDGRHPLPPRAAVDRRLPELAREHPALVHLAPALVGPPAAGLVPRRGDLRRRRAARRARAGSATPTCSTPGSRPGCGRSRRWAGPSRRRSCAPSTRPTCYSTARDIIFLWVARMVMFGDRADRRDPVLRREHPLGDPGARRPAHVEVARHRHRPARADRAPRRRRAALRPARDVLGPGRALQRGARQAGPRPRQQALERVAPDPAAGGRGRARRRARPPPSRTAGSCRAWSG